MKTATRIRRAIRRVRTVWSELDDTQRRDSRGKRSQAELDALYAVPPSKRPLTR